MQRNTASSALASVHSVSGLGGTGSSLRRLDLPDGRGSRKISPVEGPEVRYATSGDVHIAYGVVGNGPIDVVFVSGWVLSNFGVPWEGSAADFYRGMSSFARLILFDKRGLGMSDRAQGIPDLETRMDDIRAVMDAVGSALGTEQCEPRRGQGDVADEQ